jgi:hypothetical protein
LGIGEKAAIFASFQRAAANPCGGIFCRLASPETGRWGRRRRTEATFLRRSGQFDAVVATGDKRQDFLSFMPPYHPVALTLQGRRGIVFNASSGREFGQARWGDAKSWR